MRLAKLPPAPSRPSSSFDRYHDDPEGFALDVLGVTLWERQAEIAQSIAARTHVAVRSGHKCGKSICAATLALWFVATRPTSRVFVTAPTYRQVFDVIWRDVRSLHHAAERRGRPIGGTLNQLPSTGLVFDDGRQLKGFTAAKPEAFAGPSGAEMFFIVDEASGVHEAIFQTIEGTLAAGGRLFMISNPTQTSGFFYEAFHGKADFWKTIHVSSEESPNVKAGLVVIPGLAIRDWVDARRADWGENSPLYDVRVRGNFPSQGENSIIGLALIEAAKERWDETPGDGRLELGVDVARYGDDDTVIVPRRGLRLFEPLILHSIDTVEVSDEVLKIARDLRTSPDEKPRVKVDEVGVGAGVVDILKRSSEIEVVAVNAARRADDENYANLRTQLLFAVRDWLAEGGAIPECPRLEAELVAGTYDFDTQGRMRAESKDRMKARLPGHRSPDVADAAALAIYSPSAEGYTGAPPPVTTYESPMGGW